MRKMRMARTTAQRYFQHKMTVFEPIFINIGTVSSTQGVYAL